MTHDERMLRVDMAICYLKAARGIFKQLQAPKTLARVRSALRSAEGARRNQAQIKWREER